MKLYLKTVTPVHIGNGEKLNDLDYFIDANIYYFISQNEFLKFLQNDISLIKTYLNP